MKKYTIKQVDPDYDVCYQDFLPGITDYQEHPIFTEGDYLREGINEKWLYKTMDLMERCVDKYNNQYVYDDPEWNDTMEDIVNYYFSDWDDEQIKTFVEVATELSGNDCTWEDEIITRYLSAFYKTEYARKEMIVFPQINCGKIYYPAFTSDESISFIVSLYLGTYDEFYCMEKKEYRIVTHNDLLDDPKLAVAEAFDLNPEEIELYTFSG